MTENDHDDPALATRSPWLTINFNTVMLYLLLGGFGLYSLVVVDRPNLGPEASALELTLAALPPFGEYMKVAALIALGLGCYSAVATCVYWVARVKESRGGGELTLGDTRVIAIISLAICVALASGLFLLFLLGLMLANAISGAI